MLATNQSDLPFARGLHTWNFATNDTELGGANTFSLQTLRACEKQEAHPLTIPGTFGDAALLNRLPMYAKMRRLLVDFGYQFCPINELSPMRRMLGDLQLLEALQTRTIGYQPMGEAIDDLLQHRPAAQFHDFGLTRVLRFNNTHHEGSHAVMYEVVQRAEAPTALTKLRTVEMLIAGEAFAMGFELCVALAAMRDARRTTPIFLAVNSPASPFSYRHLETAKPGTVAALVALAIERPIALMTVYGCAGLVANVRSAARAHEQLKQYLYSYAGLKSSDEVAAASVLIELGLQLDPEFFNTLSPTFFRYLNLESEFNEVCARPLEYHFSPGSVFHDHFATCAKLVA